jgi:predicted nucleic acid-binding protein
MIKLSVYVETSVVSYLVARPSQNIITAANQLVTQEWWDNHRSKFEVFISQLVIDEASQGNTEEANKRLAILNDMALLTLNDKIVKLGYRFLQDKGLPAKATDDAYHIAYATVHQINYLLTWNCKHIANAQIQQKLRQISAQEGYELPILCTPYELLQERL